MICSVYLEIGRNRIPASKMMLNNTVYIYKYDTLLVTKQQYHQLTIGYTHMQYVINILWIKKNHYNCTEKITDIYEDCRSIRPRIYFWSVRNANLLALIKYKVLNTVLIKVLNDLITNERVPVSSLWFINWWKICQTNK